MGALLNEKCYASAAAAADAYFTGAPIQIVSGSTSYVTKFDLVNGVWKFSGYSVNSAGVWTLRFQTNAPVPSFPTCDEAQNYKDGIAIGWGIAAAMILAAALMSLRQGAK